MPFFTVEFVLYGKSIWALLMAFPMCVCMSVSSYLIAAALYDRGNDPAAPSNPLYALLLISGMAVSYGVVFSVCSRTNIPQ